VRKRPSLATVLSIVALFVSMTGTAMAAVIVTSNHQVAAHTIAGANAPSGDNENLIPGSVGTADLHENAVSGAKVAKDSLTGADIDESRVMLSNVIAHPTGGVLGAGGLGTGSSVSYPLTQATFTQRPGEIIEFVPQIRATLAIPSNSPNTLCQVEIDLTLDGTSFLTAKSVGTISEEPATRSVATRAVIVLPTVATSTQHTVGATARLVDHSGEGFTDMCSLSSQVDSFVLHVIGTR